MKKLEKKNLFEIVENPYPVISSNNYMATIENEIEPAIEGVKKPFSIKTKDGIDIYGEVFTANNAKGSVMISHGFTESTQKYSELIYYFLQEGYNVCIIDHRGHGNSMPYNRQDATHIDKFQTYVDDFSEVVNGILTGLPKPYYVFAHSMGGLIAATYIEQNPDTFEKAIFNAPMFEINRGGVPYLIAKALAFTMCLFGKEKEYLVGQGPFVDKANFAASAATCEERYLSYFNKQKNNPRLQNGGASYRWGLESFNTGEKLQKKKNCEKMKLPVILFQADKDDFVLARGQDRLISKIPNGEIVFVPNSKHEIYMSDDKTMGLYMRAIFCFLGTVLLS